MAFVSEIFDQVRDLLNDATDTQLSFATKKLYVNRAISLMWPRVFRVSSVTVPLSAGVYEYSLDVSVSDGFILSVEINLPTDDTVWRRYDGYDVLPGDEDVASVVRITDNPTDDMSLRIKYAQPVPQITAASYVAAQSEAWVGPDRAIHVPVAYVMAMASIRKLDDRQDTTRYSTTQATNGVTDQDLMAAYQSWMGQFELELDNLSRVLPPARD